MKTNRFMPVLLVAGIGLAGCEDIVSVDVPDGATQLVVDGWITDQPGPYAVRLSTTAPYFSNQSTPRVQGAEVTITNNNGFRDVLRETEPGVYQSATLRGQVGSTYTLSVTVAGQTYVAQTQINRVPAIDSLGVVYREETDDQDAGYYLTYFGRELPGRGDHYRIKVFRNDTLLNNPELDLFFFNDDFLDGNYLTGLELSPGPFRTGDRARVEIHAITADTYGYLVELQRQMRNDGLFASPTENVSTNITALSTNARPATGWFGGSAVQSKTISIP